MKRPPHLFNICAIIILLVVALGVSSPAAASPDSGMVTGNVTSPGGYPLPAGTLVRLFDPTGEIVRGTAIPNLDTGAFSLGPLHNGMYVLKAVPPEISGYTQSLPAAVSVVNTNVDVGSVALTTPQFTGTVFAPDGITPSPAEVFVHLGDGRILQHIDAPAGLFAVGGLPLGGYWLQAYPASDDPFWKSERLDVTIADPGIVQPITLTLRAADLWGTVTDSEGAPVAWATVFAVNGGNYKSDFSSASGFWAIGGLEPGDYLLTARPPWLQSGLLPPDIITVTIPTASSPFDLVFNIPPKIVSGAVTTNTGLPVENAQILAHRMNRIGFAETLTAADGTYTLTLTSGLWALTVKPITGTLPADWVYPQPPQLVYFQPNNQPEARTQDFTVVLADATVSGAVLLPDGVTPPAFTVTVSLHSDEGVGRSVDIAPDGSFDLTLPNGDYKVTVFPHDEGYVGPAVEPINLPVNGIVDLGTLTLLARDAAITGTVTAEGGAGLEGIPLLAWRPGVPGGLRALSGPEGAYVLAVSAGEWHIQPAPAADQPYLYTGAGADVTLAAGGVISDVNFSLLPADAAINGVLVTEAGLPAADAEGWGAASNVTDPAIHNGAPIQNGVFSILVPAGDYHVAAILPAGSHYTSAAEQLVSVASGETVTITMTVQVKDAAIRGALWDPRNEDVVEGVAGLVTAWTPGNWVAAPIETGNGTYRLDIAAGLWQLNYRIDPDAGYAKLLGPRNVPVASGDTAYLALPIVPKDAAISGTVYAPDGSPLPGATVLAKAVDGPAFNLWLQTRTDENGAFTLAVPYGRFRLGAAGGDSAWVNPVEKLVEVLPGQTSSGHALHFQLPDATLSGTLTVSNTVTAGEALVWAWSDEGGFTRGRFPVSLDGGNASGPYSLDVISNTTWHMGAAFETESEYWLGQAVIPMGSSSAVQDITLVGPFPKPAPVVVTFDAADPQTITLADGTSIYIPGGAMPATGLVTLRIVPIAEMPRQAHANVLRYGYAFLATDASGQPIEDHFNQEVVITFGYTDAELQALHIYEPWLKPAYYSTTTERWEMPESFVVDMAANQVILQIDHFTDFALTGSIGYAVYLPVAAK